jgi:hypothetical protein
MWNVIRWESSMKPNVPARRTRAVDELQTIPGVGPSIAASFAPAYEEEGLTRAGAPTASFD